MKGTSTFRAVIGALFAALICVATMFIRIPSPTGGYLNLGDGIVLLSAYLLGPVVGTAAAGIGSMLADLLAGYPAYAAGTLVIKAVSVLVSGALFRQLSRSGKTRPLMAVILSGVCAELWMALGYFLYTMIFLGYGPGAIVEVPGNLAQGAAGVTVAAVLTPVLAGNREIREILDKLGK